LRSILDKYLFVDKGDLLLLVGIPGRQVHTPSLQILTIDAEYLQRITRIYVQAGIRQ
jgi:hypothetical protein